MKATFSSCRDSVLSFLKYTLVMPILFTLGCGYAPNLLPVGADEFLARPGIRVLAAESDYPIVVTIPNSKKGVQDVDIRWTKKGALIWGQRPGNTTAQWSFTLSAPGKNDPLCQIDWNDTDDLKPFKCSFAADQYIGMPLRGELAYRLGGEPTGPYDDYRSVSRTYYMVW